VTEGGIVTVLFTDVVNSTELLTRLGDDRAEAVRRAHFATLRDAIEQHHGREVKTMGDGFMVVFASAVDALACAVAIQQSASNRDVEMRVGLHVGEPMRDGDDYFGTPVVVASRLCDAAGAGQILTSDLVHALVGTRGEFTFVDAGYLPLKGLSEPVATWEVAWQPIGGDTLLLPAPLLAGERLAFVGRDDHIHELRLQLKKAQDGHRALVMLAGEPGIGKTRLASEFAQVAHDEGAIVLFGHSDEETLLPYQPFVEALHHVVRSMPPDDVAALVGAHGGELARLLPALHDTIPDLAEPMHSDPDSERYRLFEATTGFFAALSERAPVVLVLDDLHWADKPSLLLLHHLFRAAVDFGLLVIGTYRDTDLDRRHPLASTLADLRRLVQYERVAVTGLGEDDLTRFIDLTTGREPPPGFAAAIQDQTEGNPFFIGEILRHLVESGAVSVVDGEWAPTISIDELGIPEGVTEVIGRRLSRLSDEANAVLAAAAIAGRDFDLGVLERVTEIDEERLLTALDEAVTARLVIEIPGTVGRFHFAHALVRETLYDELSTARRVRMHRRIAQALEAMTAPGGELPYAQLAYHWFEAASAGDIDTALGYTMQAGQRALEQLAYEEAVGHFDRALHLLDLCDTPDDRVRYDALMALADAHYRISDKEAAQKSGRAALEAARRIGDGVLIARALLSISGEFFVGESNPEIIAMLEEALTVLPEGDSAERVKVLARLGRELYFGNQPERMHRIGEEAIAAARRLGDPVALGNALSTGFTVADGPAELENALAMAQESLRLGIETHDAETIHWARLSMVISAGAIGDYDAIDEAIEEQQAFADEVRIPRMSWHPTLWRAGAAIARGELDEGERLALEAFTLGQEAADDVSLQMLGIQLFALRYEQGRVEEVRSTLQSLVDDFPNVPSWRAGLALIEAEAGRTQEAMTHIEFAARDRFAILPVDANWLPGMAVIADAVYLVEAAEVAATAYDLLLPFEHRFVLIGQGAERFGSVARVLGCLAATCGRYDDAIAHFERGIEADKARRAMRMYLRGVWGLAQTLRRRGGPGDDDRAASLIAAALPDADRLGLVRLAERLRALS
jgi:tetratricopeptide (TPR) repeat protein